MQRSTIAIMCRLSVVVVCNVGVLWKKQLYLESRCFHGKIAQCFSFASYYLDDDIRRDSLDPGAQTRVGWFSTSWRYISETARDKAYVTINQ